MTRPLSVREKLMDAAEALFAENGYHGVTVRDITHAAGVRLASINEIFGNTEALFEAVIACRSTIINNDRLEMLSGRGGSTDQPLALRQIVEAFSRPLLMRSQESPGWKNYLRLVAQLSNSRSGVLLLIARYFNPVAAEFVEAIGRAVPGLDQRQRLIAYQLMLASVMSIFSDNYRIDVLSADAFRSSDIEKHYQDMIRYVVAGILGMAAADPG